MIAEGLIYDLTHSMPTMVCTTVKHLYSQIIEKAFMNQNMCQFPTYV